MSCKKKGFFALKKEKLTRVIELGMNATIAYLVISCGSEKTNSISKWSVNAIEKYTSMSRGRAIKARDLLAQERLIIIESKGTNPKYRLMEKQENSLLDPDSILWIPNGVVLGVGRELSPLERLRQTGNPLLLWFLLNLYGEQNLIEDGGIARDVFSTSFTKKLINQRAQFDVFGFTASTTHLNRKRMTMSSDCLEKYNQTQREFNRPNKILQDLNDLETLGLIEKVVHLVDAPEDGEVIHELSNEIAEITNDASQGLLAAYHEIDEFDFVLPVERHRIGVTLLGTYRTVYKPRTKMTNKWYYDAQEREALFFNKYTEIIDTYGSERPDFENYG